MKKYLNNILLLTLIIGFTGCKKYLDITPKGVVIPEKISEYEGLLKSPTITQSFSSYMLYPTDELNTTFSKIDDNPTANAYFWKSQLNNEVESSPIIWGQTYRSIYNTNIIINKVMSSVDGTETKKKELLGEALAFRAAFYFDLLTIYAKAYNKATASSDPGLPFVTSIDVTETTPQRSSVQATLDVIIADLKVAETSLPAIAPGRARMNKYTAMGLLARIYLYMQDYPQAQRYAEKALAAPHRLLDYNDFFVIYDLPISEVNPEVLWHRLPDDVAAVYYFTYSADLVNAYTPDDLRFQLYATDYGSGEYYVGPPDFGTYGMTFPELYLIKAEALIRNHHVNDGMDVLNTLREKRISIDTYEPSVAANEDEALALVWHERRLELAFKGTRWMDMKRLNELGKMPAVNRLEQGTGEVIETLPAKSPGYTFEIPGRVLLFNPGMTKNF